MRHRELLAILSQKEYNSERTHNLRSLCINQCPGTRKNMFKLKRAACIQCCGIAKAWSGVCGWS